MFLPGITAVFALVLASCPSGTDSGVYKGLGEKLNISGRVYTRNIDTENFSVNYIEYKNNLAVSDGGIGGEGKIEKGQLSYSIEEPVLFQVDEGLAILKRMYTSVEFSPEDARAAAVNLTVTGDTDYILLSREKITVNLNQLSLGFDFVYYLYVDRDVIVTADGDSFRFENFEIPINITVSEISLNLKKGWNALYGKISGELKYTLLSGAEASGNLTMSVSNPSSLKWTLSSVQELLF